MSTIGLFIWALLGFAAMEGPKFFVKQNKALSGKELGQASPHFDWIRWGYPVLGILWLLLIASIHMAIGWWLKDRGGSQRIYPLLGAFLASWATFDGLFAFRTGVYSVSDSWRFRYVCEDNARLRRIGMIQASVGFIVAVAAILWAFVAPLR